MEAHESHDIEARECRWESQRLKRLDDYQIVDTLPEVCFDRIVALAANICESPIALFSLVDDRRQWFKARIGMGPQETSRAVSFCAHAVECDSCLIVEDATKDFRFSKNPLVCGKPDIRFYAGVPVRSNDGFPLGTLCVIDNVPRSLSDDNRLLLESLAREIEAQLEIRRITIKQQRLIEERAVLTNMVSHDARGIFGVLDWSLKSFRQEFGTDAGPIKQFQDAIDMLQQLCHGIMNINSSNSSGLTANIRDTTLGTWFDSMAARATTAAEQVGIRLETHFDIPDRRFRTDTNLLDRILGNLYGNAIQACSPGATITIRAFTESNEVLVIIVEDDGPGVPDKHIDHIFKPYFSDRATRRNGEGLGLPICQLAAEALEGTIQYAPREPTGARFIVRLPVV